MPARKRPARPSAAARASPWAAAASGLTVAIPRQSGGPDAGAAEIGCVWGLAWPRFEATLPGKIRRQALRTTPFGTAISVQRAGAAPSNHSGACPRARRGVFRGVLGGKRTFEKLILAPTQQAAFNAVRPATSWPPALGFWLLRYPVNTYRAIADEPFAESGLRSPRQQSVGRLDLEILGFAHGACHDTGQCAGQGVNATLRTPSCWWLNRS